MLTRVGDVGLGVCYQHDTPKTITVTVVSGSAVSNSGTQIANMNSTLIADCGHTCSPVVCSPTILIEGVGAHRVGDSGIVDGGGVYTMINGVQTTSAFG